MKFSDIDFNALGNMMGMLSEEEKEKLNSMAEDMIGNMTKPVEEEPEVSFDEAYGITDDLDSLSPAACDALEAAWDLEAFYDGEPADYSGTVLFLSKALLHELRKKDGSVTSRLQDYLGSDKDGVIQQMLVALFKAESDTISLEELQVLKDALFVRRGLFA